MPGASDGEKRRQIALLRGMLVVAVGALLIDAGVKASGTAALVLVVAFALSNVVLLLLPLRYVGTMRFDLTVGAIDLVLVGLGIHLAGAGSHALPISCLLMVLVLALGNYRTHAAAGAAAVGAMHAWLVLGVGSGPGLGRQLVLQTLFLCSVALYYGFLTEGSHRRRRTREAEDLEGEDLTTLHEILETITSSLDLRKVTLGIVSRLISIVPAVRCSIIYVDESLTRCYVIASHDNPDLDMLKLDLDKYPEIRQAIETRNPVIIKDILDHPLMADVRDSLKDVDFHSIIVIPITFGEDLLGTLFLRSARAKQDFSKREVKFCTAVARASANALKNAILHRQVLEESESHRSTGEKLARILNHSPDLILTTDMEGRVSEFNRGAEKLLGYRREEMLGKPCGLLIGEGNGMDLIERVRLSGMLPSHACLLKTKDGAELDVELHLSILKKEGEEVTGTIWVGRDVTELKSAQLQLLQAEKLSTIGEVISGVAHELNNPLSGVLGFSQLLMARHGGSPLARELEKINDAAQRCQKIVKNLLSFSRVHKPERKRLGVNGILEKTLDMKEYQLRVNNIEVVRELDPDLPLTMLDFHQMQQVFLNLINNAQHAMESVRGRPGNLRVQTSQVDGRIRVEITDNGEGMDPERLERIFDPFFTTKEKSEGTGLGLSVSYGIVNEHGGKIYASSRKGIGTTFLLELPILSEGGGKESAAAEDSGTFVAGTRRGGSILVVDDEPMILDLLVDILEETGHKVDTAANGTEACRKVGSRVYDMVITDVRMPRMNGIELYRNILSIRPELRGKVVFITGDLIDPDIVRFLTEVNAQTIPKPLEISQVTDVVHQTLVSVEERAGA